MQLLLLHGIFDFELTCSNEVVIIRVLVPDLYDDDAHPVCVLLEGEIHLLIPDWRLIVADTGFLLLNTQFEDTIDLLLAKRVGVPEIVGDFRCDFQFMMQTS